MSELAPENSRLIEYMAFFMQRLSATDWRVLERRKFLGGSMNTVSYDIGDKKDQWHYFWANADESDIHAFRNADEMVRFFSSREPRKPTSIDIIKILLSVDAVGSFIAIIFTVSVCILIGFDRTILSNSFVQNAFSVILAFYFGRAAGRFRLSSEER